jgi:oligoribonuclease NrnB/cAMP/cGMP phosphodiesterase (DHH superfamily)
MVFFHDDPDGYCAAWVAYQHFGKEVSIIRTDYGKKRTEPLQGGNVYYLDFFPPIAEILNLAGTCKAVVIMDHHISNEKLAKEKDRMPANVEVVWDTSKAGCRLAWEYFNPGKPAPKLLDHIEDYDLWKFLLPMTREIVCGLKIHMKSFEEISFMANNLGALVQEGSTIRTYESLLAENFARESFVTSLGPVGKEVRVVAVNGPPFLASQIANQISKRKLKTPIIAVFWDRGDGSRVWSLRATGEHTCLELAKSMGGGGHPHASGFLETSRERKRENLLGGTEE